MGTARVNRTAQRTSHMDSSDDDDVIQLLSQIRRRKLRAVMLMRGKKKRRYAVFTGGKRRRLKRLPQCYGDVSCWAEWEDKLSPREFMETYGVSKPLFHRILEQLRSKLELSVRGKLQS